MNKLTIFTPTYNRADTLERLYNSLINQKCKKFTWIIVDDGSTDGTQKCINKWILDNKIELEYYFQENSGKAQAHNLGVQKTKTELFVCVDSDDILTDDAVEFINGLDCSDDNSVGFLLKKGQLDGSPVTKWNDGMKKTTLHEAYSKYGLTGDTMLVYKTKVIKKYQFPKYNGEKFFPEAYLYDLIDQDGYLIAYNKILYLCEYLPDGYSANIRRLNATNPNGYYAYIEQRLRLDKKLKEKLADNIRLVAITFVLRKKQNINTNITPLFLLGLIPGWIFYLFSYSKYVK